MLRTSIARAIGPVSVSALCAAPAMAAGLFGTTLQHNYYYPNLASVATFSGYFPATNVTVTAGVEMPLVANSFSVDITNTQLILTMTRNSAWDVRPFNGPVFDDLTNNVDPIISVTVNPATTMPGIDNSRVLWTADRFGVNWQGLSFSTGDIVVLDIVTGVPAPGTAAAFGACGLLATRRRR